MPASFTFIRQVCKIIVLVTLYAKAKKADLNRAEENELRGISTEIRRFSPLGKS